MALYIGIGDRTIDKKTISYNSYHDDQSLKDPYIYNSFSLYSSFANNLGLASTVEVGLRKFI